MFVIVKQCVYKISLKEHIKSVHEKLKPFRCDACSFTTARKMTLMRHITANHK